MVVQVNRAGSAFPEIKWYTCTTTFKLSAAYFHMLKIAISLSKVKTCCCQLCIIIIIIIFINIISIVIIVSIAVVILSELIKGLNLNWSAVAPRLN